MVSGRAIFLIATVVILAMIVCGVSGIMTIIFAFSDQDDDGLFNIGEFLLGTKIQEADSDSDGLDDGLEAMMGTNPREPDIELGMAYGHLHRLAWINVTAASDDNTVADWSVTEVNEPLFTGMVAQVGKMASISAKKGVESLEIVIDYDPGYPDPTNLAVSYYNETASMFLPVDSTVDEMLHTVTARLDMREAGQNWYGEECSTKVALFDVPALFELNKGRCYYSPDLVGPNMNVTSIHIRDSATITTITARSDGTQMVRSKTIRYIPYGNETDSYKLWHGNES